MWRQVALGLLPGGWAHPLRPRGAWILPHCWAYPCIYVALRLHEAGIMFTPYLWTLSAWVITLEPRE